MMRNSVTLAVICLLALYMVPRVHAQGASVDGQDVLMLARTIVKHAEANYSLPPAYLMRIGGRPDATITAAMAFEIFARTLVLRQKGTEFPQMVPGLSLLFYAKPDAAVEPAQGERRKIAIWTPDTLKTTIPKALEFITGATQNQLPSAFVLPGGNKATAAQFTVAMAMMVKEWGESGTISESIAAPAVLSPANWDDQRNPLPLIEPVTLRITVNGVSVQRKEGEIGIPDALNRSFCGTIQIGLGSKGPVKNLTMALDGRELCTFNQAGTFGYAIDTLPLADGNHRLTITMSDQDNHSFLTILPLLVQNGRINSLTPAEVAETTVLIIEPAPL